MAKYESSVKQISFPISAVYAKLSDLNNLAALKNKLDDPHMDTLMREKLPEDKIAEIKEKLDSLAFDRDSVSVDVPPVGNVAIRIIEREEDKCIKFESTNSPIGFKLWIQLLPTSDTSCKLKLTIDAAVNMFIKAMVDKPLKEGVEKLADMLSMIPY
jgi:hypothetical protein